MPMLPLLLPYADETTVSWCARVARFHTGLTCADFLNLVEVSQGSVMDLTDTAVERLSKLTAATEAQILGCGPQKAGERLLTYNGETFGSALMTRAYTSYCPACLIDDAREEVNGDRVGRLSWMFAPVRVCPRHGIVLTRRKNLGYFERFQDMDKVAPSDQELAAQVSSAEAATSSSLQKYVLDRLSGAKGPTWMDAQNIDQAARACEMLGVCCVHGAHAKIEDLSPLQWHEAGVVGMEAASNGKEGIFTILERIVRDTSVEKYRGGPPSALGRIYAWLQLNKSKQDPGPIKDVAREFVMENWPIDPGTVLFQEVVQGRKLHSTATLAKLSGIHRKTLQRALVVTGVLPDGNVNTIDVRSTFDAKEGEALAARINNSTPIKKIPDYLNCNRTQAQMMVGAGILNKLVNDPETTKSKLSNVANEDLDDFLARFRAVGKPVCAASAGMIDTIAASELARVPVADIVRFVLEGQLARVETGCEKLRFRSVFVDPEDVRRVSEEVEAGYGLSPKEVADLLDLKLLAIDLLRANCDEDGKPFLSASTFTNARGTIKYCYAEDEVSRFLQKYVKLQAYAGELGIGTQPAGVRLRNAGIKPIMDHKLLHAKVFRRKDL